MGSGEQVSRQQVVEVSDRILKSVNREMTVCARPWLEQGHLGKSPEKTSTKGITVGGGGGE